MVALAQAEDEVFKRKENDLIMEKKLTLSEVGFLRKETVERVEMAPFETLNSVSSSSFCLLRLAVFVSVFVSVHECVSLSLCVCVCACVCVFLCVCVCTHIFVSPCLCLSTSVFSGLDWLLLYGEAFG